MVEGRVAIRDAASSAWASSPAPPPAPAATVPPTGAPLPSGFPQGQSLVVRSWLWVALGLPLAIVVSAATGSIVTFAADAQRDAARPRNHPLHHQRRRPRRQPRNSARLMRLRQKITCAKYSMYQYAASRGRAA